MSFDQLLLAGECQKREFKTSFETDRLLEADLERCVIKLNRSIFVDLGKKYAVVLHVKYAGCFRRALSCCAAKL